MPQTLYPRGTVKKIVKAHANRPLSKDADILVFLSYALFMQEYVLPRCCMSSDGANLAWQRMLRAMQSHVAFETSC